MYFLVRDFVEKTTLFGDRCELSTLFSFRVSTDLPYFAACQYPEKTQATSQNTKRSPYEAKKLTKNRDIPLMNKIFRCQKLLETAKVSPYGTEG